MKKLAWIGGAILVAMLVLVYAGDAEERGSLAEGMVRAVKSGKGGLDANGALGKLVTGARGGGAVAWGALRGR